MKNYVTIYDAVTGKRTAFLQNAYGIGYALELNSLHRAWFTLPADDPKNEFCKIFNLAEITDGGFRELYRIMPSKLVKTGDTREVTYECEQVLATLLDDVLYGWHEAGGEGVSTKSTLRYVLDRQRVRRWELKDCDFSETHMYGWENENLLAALFSVPKSITPRYRWETETLSYPWSISLKKRDGAPVAEIRYKKNMRGVEKTVNPGSLTTRLIPLGYGEGENQLTIESVNGGQHWLDSDTQGRYGVITKVWTAREYQSARELLGAAKVILERVTEPLVSYKISAVHTPELKAARVGDTVRVVDDEEGIDLYTVVTKIEKADVRGAPEEAEITLSTSEEDITGDLAELSGREKVNETYAQGAVTLYTRSFYDNCSESYPAVMRFPIPKNAVNVNSVTLSGRTAAFRGYTRATEGGGAGSSTTQGGGGTSVTSDGGGGSTVTSSSTALSNANTKAYDDGGVGSANHNHGIPKGRVLALTDYSMSGITGYATWVPSGAHTHDGHSHSVTVNSHSHSVSVPSHSHQFSIPNHTHAITHGIYTGSRANSLTVEVDGTVVETFGQSIDDLNLVPYLSKDKEGRILRSWHTVRLIPDGLTRVEFDLIIQLFANSRGGGKY